MIRAAINRTARAMGAAPAAPAGGARIARGRGCGFALAVGLLVLPVAPCAATDAAEFTAPSGQPLNIQEILVDNNPGELWLRMRFVAPEIQGRDADSHDTSVEDMAWLCTHLAVPYIARHHLAPARIVISFSDRPVPFGKAAPQAVQFFEAYRFENGKCVWEAL